MKLILRVWNKVLTTWWRIYIPLYLQSKGVVIGTGVRFYGMPVVSKSANSRIMIGDRVVLCSDSRFTALGVNHPVILRTLSEGAELIIGADTGISGGSFCTSSSLVIGREVLIGANVTIVDTDFHAIKVENRRFNNKVEDIGVKDVKIGNNVFIGANSIILKGVEIGCNSVVGAASVVTKSTLKNQIVAGNPAVMIKNI
jgi:acetyltransferase-like isoleucine patch superfamily enzyme